MARKYLTYCNIRLTQEDRKQLEAASEQAEMPASTLARKVLRQWLRSTATATLLNTEASGSSKTTTGS